MNKYKNKFRIPSCRLQGYDYGANGCYFITICTKNRVQYFGEVIDGEMQLSKIGEIAKLEWQRTFELRQDMNLMLDEFVIMPDHFHGIIWIGKNPYNTGVRRDATHCVSTLRNDIALFHPRFRG
jgi:REP element-mobilizing transposase RayT